MNREEAFEILKKYMKGEKYIKHSLASRSPWKDSSRNFEKRGN